MIMATLNGNLTETVKELEKPKVKTPEIDTKVLTTASSSVMKVRENAVVEQLDQNTGTEADVHIFLKFNFMMNSFIISLFTVDEETIVQVSYCLYDSLLFIHLFLFIE